MPVFGTDCSDFDWARGPMDVASMVRDGIVFFTHKATEGTRIQHVHYGEALNRARAAGMPVMGAYMIPRTPGNGGHGTVPQQVAYFLAYLDSQTPWWRSTPEFFIQVDTEHWSNQNGVYDAVSPAIGAQACTLLRAQTQKFVIHYAPRWSYGDTIPGSDPLWASAYGTNPAVPYRQAYPGDGATGWQPYSGRTPTFLQFGSRLTVGSQPGSDINAFRGSLAELRALITGGTGMAGEADFAFSQPYNGVDPRISGQSYVSKAIEAPLRGLTTAVGKILEAQGVAKAEIDQLLARPAATLTVTPETVQPLVDALTAVLVAHPDTPLGEADQPAIEAALDKYFRSHFGQPAQG